MPHGLHWGPGQVWCPGEPIMRVKLAGAFQLDVTSLGVPGFSSVKALLELPSPSQVGKCVLRLSLALEIIETRSGPSSGDMLDSEGHEDPTIRYVTISNERMLHLASR